MGDKMDNQDLNNINQTPMSEPVVVDTRSRLGTQVSQTPQPVEEVKPVEQPAPSLMRETIDAKGNVVSPGTNDGPDMADKTINAVEDFMNTEDHKGEFGEQEILKYKTSALLGYIPIVCLFFLIIGKYKESNYMKFHLNQALLITIGYAIVSVASTILGWLFASNTMLKDSVPGWVSFISYVAYCICFFAMMYGIITTYNNSSKELPIVGKIKLLK